MTLQCDRRATLGAIAGLAAAPAAAQQKPEVRRVLVARDTYLHYTDQGRGPPLVLVHGSLTDHRAFAAHAAFFASRYRVISYSRRFNWPNQNPPLRGYSARTDAAELRGLIRALKLEQPFVIGHSYGAYTTLLLLRDFPDLVRAAVLGEPPAVPLLREVPGAEAEGRALYDEVERKMTTPMRAAFQRGDRVGGLDAFFAYAIGRPGAWAAFPAAVKVEQMQNVREWEEAFRTGELFPPVTAAQVRAIRTPVLLLSGSRTAPFLAELDEALAKLLPNNQRVVLPGATHVFWQERPAESRLASLAFFARNGGPPA